MHDCEGCLSACQCFYNNDIVYVYYCESNKVIQPAIGQVPDYMFTGEEWILEPVVMKLFMKVEIELGICDSILTNFNKICNTIYRFSSYKDYKEKE